MLMYGHKRLRVANVMQLLALWDDECFEDNDSDRDTN